MQSCCKNNHLKLLHSNVWKRQLCQSKSVPAAHGDLTERIRPKILVQRDELRL